MKVYIGPYKNWWSPYRLDPLLKKLGFSEETRDKFCDRLSQKPFDWFNYLRGERKIWIKIHEYDTWSMDHTLAYIILPMLKQLKVTNHGSPFVDNEDVPEALRSTSAPPVEREGDTDAFHHDRWAYVMDEMIYSFEHLLDEEWDVIYFADKKYDHEGYMKEAKRIQNGLKLFGKYYQDLWD